MCVLSGCQQLAISFLAHEGAGKVHFYSAAEGSCLHAGWKTGNPCLQVQQLIRLCSRMLNGLGFVEPGCNAASSRR